MVANPNIRYLILGGPESEGHQTGEAMKALCTYGVDDRKRIIGVQAPHPVIFNIPHAFIERFRQQLTLIDLRFEGGPDVIRRAVWACYQEKPVAFRTYSLYDPGTYPTDPLSGRITWGVTQPWTEPADEAERRALEKAKAMVEALRKVSHPIKKRKWEDKKILPWGSLLPPLALFPNTV